MTRLVPVSELCLFLLTAILLCPSCVTSASPSSRPIVILEAEARSARELSEAVATLQEQLAARQARLAAMQTAFQNLYSYQLATTDALRKCKDQNDQDSLHQLEEKLQSLYARVDTSLLVEAQTHIDNQQRHRQTEQLNAEQKQIILALENQVQQLLKRETAWERTISELLARRDLLERRETAWQRTIGELMWEVETRAQRETWWETTKLDMEDRIALLSRKGTLERFGPEPYHVSIIVDLDEEIPEKSHGEIIIQLAPLDLMPHSVHLFLSQIAEGYWSRGTPAIILNAGHVLQACPYPCLEVIAREGKDTGEVQEDVYHDMKAVGLDSVSFQEYHPLFPHEKYTLGLAGRPHSGPEFYINLANNTLDHGPQYRRPRHWDAKDKSLDERNDFSNGSILEPDPCFAKVIKGFNVVDEIAQRITRAALPKESRESDYIMDDRLDNNLLVRPVRIISMTILSPPQGNNPVGEQGVQEEHGEL